MVRKDIALLHPWKDLQCAPATRQLWCTMARHNRNHRADLTEEGATEKEEAITEMGLAVKGRAEKEKATVANINKKSPD